MNAYQYSIARVHAQLLDRVKDESSPLYLQDAIKMTGQAVDRYRQEEVDQRRKEDLEAWKKEVEA